MIKFWRFYSLTQDHNRCLVTASDADYIQTFNDSLNETEIEYLKGLHNISYKNNSKCDLVGVSE